MQEIIKSIKQVLSQYYPEGEILAFARLLLSHITGKPYASIMAERDLILNEEQQKHLDSALGRLKKYEPIQYILEEAEFFGLPFYVNENVLIPRPETEELVELIIGENPQQGLNILDIGTGSGCIAIALAKYMKGANVSAWDISHLVLDVAVLNSKRNNVEIDFKMVDVLKEYPTDKKYDIMVSNPPYILEKEKQDMEQNVLSYEPHSALFVPDEKPLLFYERIADMALELLVPGGKLYFEINQAKGQETITMLEEKGFKDVVLIRDISKRDRMVVASPTPPKEGL